MEHIKPIALVWVLLASALPLFENANPFAKLAIAYIPLILVCTPKRLSYITPPNSFIILGILAYFISVIGGNSNLAGILGLMVLPAVCIRFVEQETNGKNRMYRYLALLIYLTNCFMVIAEYNLKINLLSYDLTYFDRFRATGLWVHPLFNGLIHSMCVLFIICSNLKIVPKVLLSSLGIYVVFMFDARVATVTMFVSSLCILYFQGILKFKLKNFFLISIIAIGGYYFYGYLAGSDLGGKLFNEEVNTLDAGSTEARFIALQILVDRSWTELLFGIPDKTSLFGQYGVIAIENSFVDMSLSHGLIPTCLFFYLFIRELNKMLKGTFPIKIRILLILSFIIMGISNTALSNSFVWLSFVVFFRGFAPYTPSVQTK